jgi:hypothetical protein
LSIHLNQAFFWHRDCRFILRRWLRSCCCCYCYSSCFLVGAITGALTTGWACDSCETQDRSKKPRPLMEEEEEEAIAARGDTALASGSVIT